MPGSPRGNSPRTNLEAAQPLACRCVILNGFLLLVGWFGTIGIELSDELGPVDAAGGDSNYFRLIRQYFEKLRAIHDGKLLMHEALQGKPEDTKLLRRLKGHIDALEKDLVRPLAKLPRGKAAIKRIRQLGEATRKICTAANNDLQTADLRFAEALSISTRPRPARYAVVSVDMVEYSKHALDRETQEGIEGLFALNVSIRQRLRRSIEAAGKDPASIPIYDSGDGALLFLEEGAVTAVQLAQCFQNDAASKNHEAVDKGESRRFRIGIATGDVCMQFEYNPAGSLWGFSAAGMAIVNAVRIQAACTQNCVVIDANTRECLPASLQKQYRECRPVLPKKHERRAIKVFEWRPV
jgi:class 3 adenylate cyclase